MSNPDHILIGLGSVVHSALLGMSLTYTPLGFLACIGAICSASLCIQGGKGIGRIILTIMKGLAIFVVTTDNECGACVYWLY